MLVLSCTAVTASFQPQTQNIAGLPSSMFEFTVSLEFSAFRRYESTGNVLCIATALQPPLPYRGTETLYASFEIYMHLIESNKSFKKDPAKPGF